MLKTKTITTDKATLLAIEAPKTAGLKYIDKNILTLDYEYWIEKNILLPEGNWKLLGRIPDITEEQWWSIVPIDGHPFYKDYDNGGFGATTSATESSLSLLQANEVWFDAGNTYIPHELGSMSATQHLERTLDVLDRKSKVWDKERCYLFIKVD